MNNLDKYREKIDMIDCEMVRLFEMRMELSHKISEYKMVNNMDILDKKREMQVIQKNLKLLKNKQYESALKEFFENLMNLSKKIQEKGV